MPPFGVMLCLVLVVDAGWAGIVAGSPRCPKLVCYRCDGLCEFLGSGNGICRSRLLLVKFP